jgi:hypothetical protein
MAEFYSRKPKPSKDTRDSTKLHEGSGDLIDV